eukprot:TRINITY_DN801_c0_g1_i1.p1 TRINITY_DN801_c0_g1~~TRINITY_DN801_c0_g1_i1.p1  ORF type:complete len:1173 (-),score=657.80 TRINITY_DN801_c0_g1_i1:49-3567(-)
MQKMEAMFKRSLADLVRGIRSHKKDEQGFINKALAEIKEEIKTNNNKVKMVAVQKLTYLHMLGYDVNWSAFYVVEVMSQTSFTAKRIGYLAASQTFHDGTDVIMLTTNLIKRDITSLNTNETLLALGCVSNIFNEDLARDLAPDLVSLLASSKPAIRKRAVIATYKACLRFPSALRPAYPRLKEKLEDTEMSVVSSAVNVICELARKNPTNYLALAPVLFKILTTSNNNWVLIKIIKLFAALTPSEKRLAKKLEEPLSNIINTTTATSLLYECIQTCTTGLPENKTLLRLCISKLRAFIEDQDQNLKYLGLCALYNIMKIDPKAVQEYKDVVVFCLNDEDVSIRMRALDLLIGMVNKRNITDVVGKLIEKLDTAEGDFREGLIENIIEICSQNNYVFVSDFEWYISILVKLSGFHGTNHGCLIRNQLMDVCIRVKVVREYGVQSMIDLLQDTRVMNETPRENGICEVLYAAAWIVGEFLENAASSPLEIVEILLNHRAVLLPGHIQSVYIQNSLKALAFILKDVKSSSGSPKLENAIKLFKERLPGFCKSSHTEAQERACFALSLIGIIEEFMQQNQLDSIKNEVASLFEEVLNPVAPKAQKKVPLPEGLNLSREINSPPSSDSDSDHDSAWDYGSSSQSHGHGHTETSDHRSPESRDSSKKSRQQRSKFDPYYLGDVSTEAPEDEYSNVHVETLTIDPSGPSSSSRSSSSRSSRDKRHGSDRSSRHKKPVKAQVMAVEEMPEGAAASDDEKDKKEDDIFGNIDLTSSLRPDEELRTVAYPLPGQQLLSEPTPEKKPRDRRRSDKDRDGRRSDRDRDGRRSDKDRHREPSDRRGRGRESDRDRPDRHSSSKDSSAAPAPSSSSSSGKNSSADLLGLGFSSSPAPVVAAAVAPSPSPVVSSIVAEPKTPSTPSSPSITPKPSSSSSSSSSERSSRSSRKPSGGAPELAASAKQAFTNREIALHYEHAINPAQTDKVLISFNLHSLTTTRDIHSLVFTFSDNSDVQLVQPADTKPKLTISPGSSQQIPFLLKINSIVRPQAINCSLTYKAGSRSSSPITETFAVQIPTSVFLRTQAVSIEDFTTVLQSSSMKSASTRVTTPEGGPKVFLEKITALLHTSVVQVTDAAFLYAISLQNHHVCILAKRVGDEFKIDLKCSDSTLADTLIQEINKAFR